jgi:hypothetical protein
MSELLAAGVLAPVLLPVRAASFPVPIPHGAVPRHDCTKKYAPTKNSSKSTAPNSFFIALSPTKVCAFNITKIRE